MTTPQNGPTQATAECQHTLADVIDEVEARTGLSDRKKRDLASTVNNIAKLLDRPPLHVVLDMQAIGKRLESVNPIARGMSAKRFANLRSEFPVAVAESGLLPGVLRVGWRRQPPLTAEWASFKSMLVGVRAQAGLSRLVHFASNSGIEPRAVDDSVIDSLVAHMKATSLRSQQHKIIRAATRIWNEVAAEHPELGLRRLTVPDRRTRRTRIPWSDFPESLHRDVDDYCKWLLGDDPFDAGARDKPLKSGSVIQIRGHSSCCLGFGRKRNRDRQYPQPGRYGHHQGGKEHSWILSCGRW